MFVKYLKWIGLAAAVLLVISCFLPWIYIEEKNLEISGVNTTGTNFGKPAYFHFAMTLFFLVFILTPKVWAKRANFLVVALNLAWAVKNFLSIPACQAGDCPVRKTGIILMLLASAIMLIAALFPDMELPAKKRPANE